MFNIMHSLVKRTIILTSAIICLTLASCNMEKHVEETDLYDYTVTQSYPKDNILALKSVRLDAGAQGNRCIIEFDTSSEYITREALEAALNKMEEKPDRILWGIEGESAEQVKALEVLVTEEKNSLCVILLFAPQVECDYIEIKLGNQYAYLDGPWESPSLQVVDYTYVQDGAEGVLYRQQEYDDREQQWKECRDSFYENQDPIED